MHNINRLDSIKKQFPEILKKHMGIVSSACKASGIGRATYYYWFNNDIEFKEACMEAYEEQKDFVESQLLKNIKENDTTAIIFYLKTKAKDRGYSEKIELEQYGNKEKDAIQQETSVTINESDQHIIERYFNKKLAEYINEQNIGYNIEK